MLEELYSEYLKELESYSTKPFSEDTCKNALTYYRVYGDHHHIEYIVDGNKLVGFFITGWGNACHPNCDYYICQSYITPSHRNRGLMSKTFNEWIHEHPGTYCLDVLFNNYPARDFWLRKFRQAGYKEIHLQDYKHGLSDICDTLYFTK